MKTKFLLAIILTAIVLCGCQTARDSRSSYPIVVARMGESPGFPSEAAGFSRGDTVAYEPGRNDISVGYNLFTPSAQQAVTFYFYPKNQPIEKQIESEKKMIERFQEEAVVLSQSQQMMSRDKLTFQAYTVNYRVKGIMINQKQALYSQLILIELPERYVKVRSTCPIAQADAANGRLRDLMEQIDWRKKP